MWIVRNMSKLAFTPTTPQAHSCVCDPNQMNALALTNQYTENIQSLPMPTSIIHATPPLTHSRVRLVSLPRASTLPENLLLYRSLNVRCAQHGQTCVHANNTLVTFLVCDPNQMNALALTNQCTENVPLYFLCLRAIYTQALL